MNIPLPKTDVDIPGYKVEGLIAEGGMASVYLAIQESLDRRVALKLLRKFDNTEQSQRFIKEGRIIASLNHPNIITIHDVGVIEGQHYISMEYLEGGDLGSKLQKGVTPETALKLLIIIGKCLSFVHGKGIVHRDIKPANILFRNNGTPVLTDFGIAKQLDQDTKLTRDGTTIGSPDYLSPEQAECKPTDGRADLYGLGIILYEMLAGYNPFHKSSHIETLIAHIKDPIPPLPDHLQKYQGLIDGLIAKRPGERFDSAADMVKFIGEIGHTSPVKEKPAMISGVVHNQRDSKTQIISPAKTLKIDHDGLTTSPSAVVQKTDGDGFQPAMTGPSGVAGKTTRYLLLLGMLTVLVAGSVWMFGRAPEDLSTGTSLSEVERYLLQAKLAIEADKLTNPPQDSAYRYYTEVIKLAPDHQEAHQGLILITDRYADLANQALDRSDYVTARRYASKGLRVRRDNAKLIAIRKKADLGQDVEQYLLKAKVAMASHKLTRPAKDNAYRYYKEIIKLVPDHKVAHQGLEDIADRYADLTEQALDRYDYVNARQYANKGLLVRPGNARLTALKKKAELGREVDQYLLKAKVAMESHKLTRPAQDNAYRYYKKVIKLAPGHREAYQGLEDIANRYADLAEHALDRFNYANARRYVDRGLGVQPGNRRLLAIRGRTKAITDVPNRLYKGVKSVLD